MGCTQIFASGHITVTSGHLIMKTSFPSSDRPVPLMYCARCNGKMLIFVLFVLTINKLFCSLTIH